MVGTIMLVAVGISVWFMVHFFRQMRMEIKSLKRENGTLVRAMIAQSKRIDASETDSKRAIEIAIDCQKQLTSEPPGPKLVTKPAPPKRVNWRQAKAALEANSDPEEEE